MRRLSSLSWRGRALLFAAGLITLAVGLAVVLGGKAAAPSTYLYSDAEQAYYIDWHAHGVGTVWASYVNPENDFQVESGTSAVTVTLQGSAVSVQTQDGATPTLGLRSHDRLTLNIGNDSAFGAWVGSFTFSVGSLKDYETAVAAVQQTGATIAQDASEYASQDVADADRAATASTDGACILYLSGTDVSVTMHGSGSDLCRALVSRYGDLGSGGTWSPQQSGANYPGQASLACEYANAQATTYVIVADAGFQQYGGQLCDDLASAGGWYAIRSAS